MSIKDRSIEDLIAIVREGGGLDFDASGLSIDNLVHLAQSARVGTARLTFRRLSGLSTLDLMNIGKAGDGWVTFVD